ncbi:hypothetical protein BC835DRAFT_1364126 [Cytidiella melzeri]|nr:hypothetical protein BC835DRAFT_1364126 [Cytidiella melzeri]
MPTRYNSSAASSLCSQPLSSRASSRTAVVTPLEDFRTSRYVHSDTLAPVGTPGSDNSKYSSNSSTYRQPSQRDRQHDSRGSYFSLPLDHTSEALHTAPLTHRRTTKELVGKYESLSSPTKSVKSSITSSKQPNLVTPESNEKKGKGRSPIRQSFRSLLSVFSKKGRLSRELSTTLTPEIPEDGIPIASLLSSSNRKLEPLLIPDASQPTPSHVACNTPSSLHSGRLFHMSRPTPESLPVWTDCNVLLHPTHMLITWMTSHSNPSTSIVTLAECSDVRSLVLDDLVTEERDLLPTMSDSNELWIFELLFEGKAREKFAAVSIKDRAGWVAAVWDAVLQMSEEKTYTPSMNVLRGIAELETPISTPRPERTNHISTSEENMSCAITSTQRDLPPLPNSPPPQTTQSNSPVRIALYDPPMRKPATPLTSPTRSVTSRLPSPSPSHSQSPSIRNLDHKSVVKQRLAEIERNASRSSSPSLLTEKSSRGRQIMREMSESPIAWPKRSILLRHGTVTTVGGESVVDLFTGGKQDSPLSAYSQGLLSIPSGESLDTSANPWSTDSRLTTPEPLRRLNTSSVASYYSTDSAATERAYLEEGPATNASKPLPQLVIPLEEASPVDGGRSTPVARNVETRSESARSTRSLSIFSPSSPYSHGSVAREQASAALHQLRNVGKPISPVLELARSPSPEVSPMPSVVMLISDSTTSRSPQSRSQAPHAPTSTVSPAPHQSLDPSVPLIPAQALSRHVQAEPAHQAPISSKSERESLRSPIYSKSVPEHQLPLPSLSVFSSRWQDTEEASHVESQPATALFSRFAKILPELPLAVGEPVVRDTKAVSSPAENAACEEHRDRLTGLEDKLGNVEAELRNLPGHLRALAMESSVAIPDAPPTVQGPETKTLLQDIDGLLKRVEISGERHAESLGGIHQKIDALLSLKKPEDAGSSVLGLPSISGLPNSPATLAASGGAATSEIMDKLEEIRNGLRNDLPMLSQKLEEMLAAKSPDRGITVNPAGAATPDDEGSETTTASATAMPSVDTAAIYAKLDEMLAALQAKPLAPEEAVKEPVDDPNPLLREVLDLLNSDKEERTKVLEQQADSARYLNELNTWLETFVNHGTSQIEAVASGVEQLCADLGPMQSTTEDGRPIQHNPILSDIRQLLVENKGRDENMLALHGSVNGLMAAVQENLQQGVELRNTFNQDAILGLIEQQRQNQEHMLRALAHELSDDIRGERLRFVEAMKEATTINVQIHVEEFKKELTREVMLMTQEVDRLHKERQGLEQHIADLFAFYAKQKQMGSGERKKGKPAQQRPPPQNPQTQNVYYGVPGVPGFMGPAAGV